MIKKKEGFSKLLNCRATHAVFVVPYQKYIKSITNAVCIGTRFKMRFEMDDSPERRSSMIQLNGKTNSFSCGDILSKNMIFFLPCCRCSGVVTGTADLDPYKWPNSKWRCLMVRVTVCLCIILIG